MGNDLARRVRDNTGAQPGTAVEKADREKRAPTLAQQIQQMQQQFALAMPRGAEAVQLVRDALTCLRTTPKLAECQPASVLGGLMTCAQLGLRPGVLGHAWLLPFWDSRLVVGTDSRGRPRLGGFRAQLVIGYQGYRELAQRSGQIATVIGRAVHEHDVFDVEYGLADNLVHKPRLDGPRGEAVGYYAIVKYTAGGYAFWHISKTEAEEHRDRYAMAKNKEGQIVGPWRDNFDEMAVKTAFLRLAKWMPKSTELASAIEADGSVRLDLSPDPDALLHGEHPDVIDAEPVDEPPAEPLGEAEPPTDIPAEPASPTDTTATMPAATRAQLTRIHTALSDCGVTDRAERLTYLALMTHRETLASSSDLTREEASAVIDTLGRCTADSDPVTALSFYLGHLKDEAAGQ